MPSSAPTENILVEADEDGHFTARIDGEEEGTASRYAERMFGPARGTDPITPALRFWPEIVRFWRRFRAALIKSVPGDGKKGAAERELAIQQIVSRAVVSTEIVDIMKAAGFAEP